MKISKSILLIFVLAFVIAGCNQTPLKTASPSCKDVQIPYEAQEEYLKTEYYSETVPYTDTQCEAKELAYSVDNFAITQNVCNRQEDVCTKYFLGICSQKKTFCVDKTISCSLDLRNLDAEERGGWKIKFNFLEAKNKNNILKTDEESYLVYAQSSTRFTGTVRITSSDEEGDANKGVSCIYQVTETPKKQVCKDTIKYKDVQKERKVTAYKPVTKYRTERQCSR